MSSTDHKAPHYVFFSTPCYLVPLRPKYHPQHLILEHPQPLFHPQCERPSFTPVRTACLIDHANTEMRLGLNITLTVDFNLYTETC